MSADWIEGEFEGIYSGERRRLKRRGRGADRGALPRRFGFEIESGCVRDVRPCAGIPPARPDERVIRQSRVTHVRLVDDDEMELAAETALFEVEIREFRLLHPAETADRAYGTVVGRLRARRRPFAPEIGDAAAEATDETVARGPIEVASPPPDRDALAGPTPAPKSSPVRARRGPQVDRMLARLGWAVVLVALALVATGFALQCGSRWAAVWLAPVALGLLQLQVVRQSALPQLPGWFGFALVGGQLLGVAMLVERAQPIGCETTPGLVELAALAAPIVLAATLGARAALFWTALVWTGVCCAGCLAIGPGACPTSRFEEAATLTEGMQPGDGPRSSGGSPAPKRTDSEGRWPAIPSLDGATGRNANGSAAETAIEGDTGLRALPSEPAATATRSTGGSESAAATRSSSGSEGAAAVGPPTSVRGGWLSPEHRDTRREARLISLEQANRTPALFYDSGGLHRVYVPTDPIFRGRTAELHPGAPLVLARIAALLSLPGAAPVRLEVHGDAAGAPEQQLALAQRRADRLRGWLLDRGHVAADRFELRAVGGVSPLVPVDGDYAAQRPNRRIEIRLIGG